jgi:hypothetical protein
MMYGALSRQEKGTVVYNFCCSSPAQSYLWHEISGTMFLFRCVVVLDIFISLEAEEICLMVYHNQVNRFNQKTVNRTHARLQHTKQLKKRISCSSRYLETPTCTLDDGQLDRNL